MSGIVHQGDNLEILRTLEDNRFQMIYIDPPFNTGQSQTKRTTKATRRNFGVRGLSGENYSLKEIKEVFYSDIFEGDEYWSMMIPRLIEGHRVLKQSGTFYLHLDWREVFNAKFVMDAIFGEDCFLNEIIWAYDYGAKSKKKWPTKHENILVYVKNPKRYYFNSEAVDREPYMAPGLVSKEKAEKGKLPTTVWWHTIVATNGSEKTGYPNQKPEGIIRRMIQASTRKGDEVLDYFAGSGTVGAVAKKLERDFYMIDDNEAAIDIMDERLEGCQKL